MRRWISLVLVIAACGDDNRKIQDAAPAGVDAPPATVTVIVKHADGSAAALVPVYFQAADSTMIASVQTGPAGTTSALMPDGGSVTILDPDVAPALGTAGHHLYTWTGVKPGDHLIYDTSGDITDFPIVYFQVPFDTMHAGVTSYDIESSCGGYIATPTTTGATFTQQISLYGCNGIADVMVTGLDDASHAVSYFYVPGQAIVDQATIDFATQTYALATTRTFTLTHNDAPSAELDFDDTITSVRGTLYTAYAAATLADPAIATVAIPVAPIGSSDVLHMVQHTPNTKRERLIWGPTTDLTIDYAATRIPDFASPPAFDPGTHVVAWTATSTATAPDLAVAQVSAARTSDTWVWEIAGPGASQLRFPVVPADAFDPNIAATDTFAVESVAIAKVPNGYDAIRGRVFQFTPAPGGATGAISRNTYEPPPPPGFVMMADHASPSFTSPRSRRVR